MRIHHILHGSYANGPGCRLVLFLQGCNLNCPGCYNPATHSQDGGINRTTDDLLQDIFQFHDKIEGVTISGGEPLLQIKELIDFTTKIKATTSLSVILFTGYAWDEIQKIPEKDALLVTIDLMIAGRYQHNTRVAKNLIGSQNKTLHFLSERYKVEDLYQTPPAEIIIDSWGEIELSGIDPMCL